MLSFVDESIVRTLSLPHIDGVLEHRHVPANQKRPTLFTCIHLTYSDMHNLNNESGAASQKLFKYSEALTCGSVDGTRDPKDSQSKNLPALGHWASF